MAGGAHAMFICRIFRAIGFTAYGWLKIIDEDWAVDLVTGWWNLITVHTGCMFG
jgi:hypothetical protein